MKISILTPSYNSGKFISRAIESVLNQNYKNWEHIIVDGGSKDNTLEILKGYSHLKWISEPDKGQSDAMNKAFDMSTGDIIVYLNADDWFEPKIFQEIISNFKTYNIDILVGNIYLKYEDKATQLNISEHRLHRIILPFRYGFPYNPISYFYRRKVQLRVGPFPTDEHFVMDYIFILKAFAKPSQVKKINQVFGTYYHSGNNKTSVNDNLNLEKYAFESVKNENKELFFYFFIMKTIHRIITIPFNHLKLIFKCLVILMLKGKFIPKKHVKEHGFRYYIPK